MKTAGLQKKHTSSCLHQIIAPSLIHQLILHLPPSVAPAVVPLNSSSKSLSSSSAQPFCALQEGWAAPSEIPLVQLNLWCDLWLVSPQMDPVQKAVMTHTFGPPIVKTKRPIISCNVCQIRFNSEVRTLQQLMWRGCRQTSESPTENINHYSA